MLPSRSARPARRQRGISVGLTGKNGRGRFRSENSSYALDHLTNRRLGCGVRVSLAPVLGKCGLRRPIKTQPWWEENWLGFRRSLGRGSARQIQSATLDCASEYISR